MENCEQHNIGARTVERLVSATQCDALNRYGIGLVGFSEAKEGFSFIRVVPGFAQVLLTLDGWGWVMENGVPRQCHPGMAYVTPARVPHHYWADASTHWRCCWVMYRQWQHLVEGRELDAPMLLDAQRSLLPSAIEGLLREVAAQNIPVAADLWAHLIHTYAQRVLVPSGVDQRVQTLWEAVENDLAHPWTREELAERLGVSGEHLRRLCRDQLGRTPMRHVTHLRMQRAMGLLGSASYTVEDVAQRVGYDNVFAFSTAFKRCIGVSPSAYRQRTHHEE